MNNKMEITDKSGLAYTMKAINKEFRIKVNGIFEGKKVNTAVGVSGLIRMVKDIDLINRMLKKAFATLKDCFTIKLRRGLKISFYIK